MSFDAILEELRQTSDDSALREFAFLDKKGHPCWTALCSMAAEIDACRKGRPWAVNMLHAHDLTGKYKGAGRAWARGSAGCASPR
eukprot:6610300-Prymnesium_polylepis.1